MRSLILHEGVRVRFTPSLLVEMHGKKVVGCPYCDAINRQVVHFIRDDGCEFCGCPVRDVTAMVGLI